MQSLVEEKLAAMRRVGWVDVRPAGEDIGEARDVALRIAAADTERVQLENFAGEIFVDTLVGVDTRNRVDAHGSGIVEVVEHRRMGFDGDQHVGETPEHMGADRLALISAGGRDVLIG